MARSPKTYTRQPSPSQSSTGEAASPAPETTPPGAEALPAPATPQASARADASAQPRAHGAMPAAPVKEYQPIEAGAQYVPASEAAPNTRQVYADAGQGAPPEGQAAMPAAHGKEYQQLDAGAQYVPAPKPPTLLEILPVEYQTTRPPLIYRLSTVSEPARPDGRIAQSRTYRARAFSCGVFYKPISRCLTGWEEK